MRSINFLFSVLGLMLITFFFGCRDKGYEIPPADGRVVGSIHGIVQDNYTKERIAGAEIQYVVGGEYKTVKTDSLGYYFISGLGTGEYELTVFANGNYAKGKSVVSVPSIEEVAGPNPSLKDYNVSLVEDIFLYKLNAGVTGSLYAQDSFGNMQPAANITIIVRFSDSGIEPAVYSTTTDNDGNYLFDKNLPAYNNYYTVLYSLPFTLNGIDYNAASISNINLTPEINIKASNLVASISTSSVVLISSPFNQTNFDPAANFQFVFSKSVDISTVDIQLRRNDYYGTVVYFEDT
jgi:Carboxypeptidase regulatory-like domain